MKRFFASDAESDMLIAEATKTFGLKIGDIKNICDGKYPLHFILGLNSVQNKNAVVMMACIPPSLL